MAEPKIRFPKFADDWKQYKIGEVGSFYYGRSCPKWSVTENATIPCVRYGELYTKFGSKIDKVYSYTNIQADKLRFSKGTEVLIPRVGEDPMDYNHCTWLSISNVAIGEMISVYNTKQNPLFTAMMFNATLRNEFAVRVEGFSVTNLYFEELKNITVYYPCLEEQQKIADFLSTVDEVISHSEAEVQNLERQKKGAMQKIFSQEVRFKREDGTEFPEWEERLISDICSIKTGNSNSQDQTENGRYPFYIRSETPVKSNRYIFDCEAVLTIGDGNIGKVFHYVNGKFDLHQRVYIMNEFHSNIYAKYFYYYFSMFFYKRAMRLNAKGTVNSVRREMIADMTIYIPHKEEQQKIADFLSAYDEAITYAKAELNKWKELKKGLLQQMFV